MQFKYNRNYFAATTYSILENNQHLSITNLYRVLAFLEGLFLTLMAYFVLLEIQIKTILGEGEDGSRETEDAGILEF